MRIKIAKENGGNNHNTSTHGILLLSAGTQRCTEWGSLLSYGKWVQGQNSTLSLRSHKAI
jgi:hypothetical protein